jgi:hypothetical protein
VDLVKGKDSINLTAPEKTGIYKIKAQSRYGISEKDIEIIDKIPIETPMSPGRGSHVTDGKPDILIRPC